VHEMGARAMHEHQRQAGAPRRSVMKLVADVFAVDGHCGHSTS